MEDYKYFRNTVKLASSPLELLPSYSGKQLAIVLMVLSLMKQRTAVQTQTLIQTKQCQNNIKFCGRHCNIFFAEALKERHFMI